MTSAVATQFLPVVGTASETREFLVTSIHDVAPSTQPTADKMLADLAKCGVRSCSLLVVPDYHHQGGSMQNRRFVDWLRDLESSGHEIVIHGYFHQRPRQAREDVVDKLVTRFYTQDEGEFYDLGYDDALQRIKGARDQFRAVGLTPRGFVAPAWLMNDESERAARDAEMEYTTRLRDVRDLRSGEIFPAHSLVYSVRNSWRRATSLAWNATLSRLLKNKPLMRLSIHPPDYSHPAIWRQIIALVRAAQNVRTSTTYQDWIADQRLKGAQ